MNLLLNGCSFLDSYYYAQHFTNLLGATTVNLAKPGSSNRRIIRTTVDYLESTDVDFVILGLTFYDRQEGPFLTMPRPREGHWVSYNSQGFQATFVNLSDFDSELEYKMTDDYVKSRYRYDIGEQYLEQLYLDLRMFAGYMRDRGTGFCVFNTCDRHHWQVDLGPEFVPFDFIGNEYLEQMGSVPYEQDMDLPKNARHHYREDVKILVDYLIEYIGTNNLLPRYL
jgi:hypothetical protein